MTGIYIYTIGRSEVSVNLGVFRFVRTADRMVLMERCGVLFQGSQDDVGDGTPGHGTATPVLSQRRLIAMLASVSMADR